MRMLEEDKAFWRETYDIWRDFKYCRSKIIYAADLLESLQMRLTYFLHNSQEVSSVNITLPPFEFGIKQVSYTILVWHYFHKENEQSWSLNEKEWINFCMNYSEVNYVMDLKSKGLRKRHQKWQRRSAKKCKFTSSISRARGMRQLMCFQP
ncbi:hypothetical protein O6H91_Y148100 [Diphasiastrum complanatum]|nr:hypothetical protein O6H91_Y148100 [Diphasiastrum complanatum]